MKKVVSLFLVLVIYVFAVGCDPASFHFDVEVYGDQVEKIELRYSELSGTSEIIKISDGAVPEFHIDETFLVENLDVNRNMDFCNELALVSFHRIYECVNKPFGYILVMYLSNGNYIVLSCSRYGKSAYGIFAEFNSEEEFIQLFGRFCENRKYYILLSKYFDSCDVPDWVR